MVLRSSRPLREPFLDLSKIKPDVFPELEMRDGVGGVLAGSVIDKRGWYSQECGEFRGFQKLVQSGILLGAAGIKDGSRAGRVVLWLCSAVLRHLRNERVSSARWVWNPKFCPYVISCRRRENSVASRGTFFSARFKLMSRGVASI